jgi:hypothetical protein
MSPRPTLSQAGRAAACPQSFWLDQTHDLEGTPARRFGLEGHDYLKRALVVGRDEALLEIEDQDVRDRCALIRIERLPASHPDGYSAEVGLALNVKTGAAKLCGQNMTHARALEVGRALGDDWIMGVADVLGVTPDRSCAIVMDYKTGWKRVAPARTNRQLRGYAVAAARAMGCTRAVVAIIYVKDDDRDPWFDSATLDTLDLDDVYDELVEMMAGWERARADVAAWRRGEASLEWKTGEHCRHCPAFGACGAQVGILMRTRTRKPGESLLASLSDADAEAAMRELDDVERALKAAKLSLYAFATARPVRLASGLVYGPVVGERSEINGDAARALLLEQGYPEMEINRAMSWRATAKSIEAIVGPHAPPRGKAKMIAETMAALRARGAVKTKYTTTVKVHRPGDRDRDPGEEG